MQTDAYEPKFHQKKTPFNKIAVAQVLYSLRSDVLISRYPDGAPLKMMLECWVWFLFMPVLQQIRIDGNKRKRRGRDRK